MARNRQGAKPSEMLNELKSRLGFSSGTDSNESYADYDAEYSDYDSYGDYDAYEDDYDPAYDDCNTQDTSYDTYGSYGNYGQADSSPNLISLEDVREHSRALNDASRYEPTLRSTSRTSGARSSGNHASSANLSTGGQVSGATTSYRTAMGRDVIKAAGPAPSSPAYTAARREANLRSEGLNSLFESTAPRQTQSSAQSQASQQSGISAASYTNSYASSAQSKAGAHTGSFSLPNSIPSSRGLTVVKPVSYNDVEGVARAIKAGDAVILAMKNTPDDLFKRILDFSFGVASALDASVDCPAAKVYVIVHGGALSDEEKSRLRTQGVL